MGAATMPQKPKRERVTVYMHGGYKDKLEDVARYLRVERMENVSLSDAVRAAIDLFHELKLSDSNEQ